MEIKLTPEMFEAANWGPNNVGQTWDEMKQNSDSRICSIDPIPFEGQVYIPIQTGYRFCIAQFDENQKNLGSHTYYDWRSTPQMCPLDPRTKYIGLCFGGIGDVNKISQILGGGIIMSNYPTLPIVKDSSGFEYAEGMNLCRGIIDGQGNDFGSLGNWAREFKDDTSLPTGHYARCTCKVKPPELGQWGVYLRGDKYKETFVYGAPMTFSIYVRASREITFYMSVEFAEANKHITVTKSWQRVDFSVICKRNPDSISKTAVCFYSTNWNIDDYIDLSSPMLTFGTKVYPYRPNPADLVGGGAYEHNC